MLVGILIDPSTTAATDRPPTERLTTAATTATRTTLPMLLVKLFVVSARTSGEFMRPLERRSQKQMDTERLATPVVKSVNAGVLGLTSWRYGFPCPSLQR